MCAGRLYLCAFSPIYCAFVCVWTAIVCKCSSRGFKVNYSCKIWIHANGSLPSPGTDPGYLWQRRLQEASLHPSSSCFSQAPTLRPCYPPSGIVSIVAIPGWVAAHCGVAGYPIIHSQGHVGRKGWEMEGWRVDRWQEGRIPPSRREVQETTLSRWWRKGSGFRWWTMLSPMRRTGHTLTCYSDLVTAHAH